MAERKWYHSPQRRWEDRDVPEVSYRRLTAVTFLILGAVCLLWSGMLWKEYAFGVSIPIKQEVLTYENAAYYMYDPLVIVQTLNRTLQGIENLGLEPEDNAALFVWDQNYRHTVGYTIDQINSIIDYGYTVIEWKEQSYHNNTVIENVNDVYAAKVTKLRELSNDADTNVIEVAYCFKYGYNIYPYGALYTLFGLLVFCFGLVFLIFSQNH